MNAIDDFLLFIIIHGMKKRRLIRLSSTFCILFLLSGFICGCAGEVFGSVDDYRAVVIVRADDSTFDFKSARTYQLVGTVLDLAEPAAVHVMVDHARDEAILEELEIQLQSRHLQNVELLPDLPTGGRPAPDVIIFASLIAQKSWDYHGPVNYREPLYSVVQYSGAPSDMAYDVESVIITMISPTAPPVSDHPNWYQALWTAGIHNAYADMTEDSLRNGIATAFELSPYINATGGAQ